MTVDAREAMAAAPVTPDEYRLPLQHDFHAFLDRSFREPNPRTPFLDNWHIEVLSAKLESVRLGKTKHHLGREEETLLSRPGVPAEAQLSGAETRAEADLFKPEIVLIEDRASGTQLIQELRNEGLSQVKKIAPEGDKIMRLHAQTAAIENGFVHLPRDAPWLETYLAEMMSFPRGRHDDQVDSTAQALAWLANPTGEQGWLEYARQQLEKANHPIPGYTPSPPRKPREIRDPVTGEVTMWQGTW